MSGDDCAGMGQVDKVLTGAGGKAEAGEGPALHICCWSVHGEAVKLGWCW